MPAPSRAPGSGTNGTHGGLQEGSCSLAASVPISDPQYARATRENTRVASEETSALISANKVEGTTVKNPAGEKLGSIEEIMIDKRSGKVAYAVMSFGGFLGIGDRHHPLPWRVLKYDTKLEGYIVNLEKRVLEKSPTYGTIHRVDLVEQR